MNNQKTPHVELHSSKETRDAIKMIGILHLAGNLISGGILGTLLVAAYYLIKKDTISALEKETCFEVINFNLSFLIYSAVAGILILVIIGIFLLPVVGLVWLILMIVGFMQHIEGKNYQYPLIIRFLT